MNADNYKLGMRYEAFIRQAYDEQLQEKHGGFQQYIQNLIGFEKGEAPIAPSYTHANQLADIKKYMSNALKAASKRNYANSVKQQLSAYFDEVGRASTASELLAICEKGLDLFANNTT